MAAGGDSRLPSNPGEGPNQTFPDSTPSVGNPPPDAYTQLAKRGLRDDYTIDLFGIPTDTGADTAAGRPAARRQDGPLSRDDAPGTYATRTAVVEDFQSGRWRAGMRGVLLQVAALHGHDHFPEVHRVRRQTLGDLA